MSPNTANLGAMGGLFAAYDASSKPTLESISPNTQSVAIAAAWTIAVTGDFPDPNPSDYRLILHTPDGQELEEEDVNIDSPTQLTVRYTHGPPAGSQAGEGYAELRLESRQLPHGAYGRAPFTWTP